MDSVSRSASQAEASSLGSDERSGGGRTSGTSRSGEEGLKVAGLAWTGLLLVGEGVARRLLVRCGGAGLVLLAASKKTISKLFHTMVQAHISKVHCVRQWRGMLDSAGVKLAE